MRICLFFSTVFPYETTLQNELPLLAKEFDRVYYFPSTIKSAEKGLTNLPENIILETLLSDNQQTVRKASLKLHGSALKLYCTELLKKGNFRPYLIHFKTYYSILIRNLRWASLLESFIEQKELDKPVAYDYWFENATIAIARLKQKGKVKLAFTRAHRFDLYDDSWGKNGKVPFRTYKLRFIDKVYTVARHGQEYLTENTPESLKHKIKLSYLGIKKQDKIAPHPDPNEHLIVSVSNTRDFKRVHKIPDVLKAINRPIHWVHFGSGPMDKEVKEAIKTLPDHIKSDFKGFVPNSEVLEFLRTKPVSVFLSLSLSEGLPISMMESLSFGIPVLACNVCGIPDIINEFTGSLFEPEDSIQEIARKLESQLSKQVNREQIHNFAIEMFDYEKNFHAFIKSAL